MFVSILHRLCLLFRNISIPSYTVYDLTLFISIVDTLGEMMVKKSWR